jgi:hypothetical protein
MLVVTLFLLVILLIKQLSPLSISLPNPANDGTVYGKHQRKEDFTRWYRTPWTVGWAGLKSQRWKFAGEIVWELHAEFHVLQSVGPSKRQMFDRGLSEDRTNSCKVLLIVNGSSGDERSNYTLCFTQWTKHSGYRQVTDWMDIWANLSFRRRENYPMPLLTLNYFLYTWTA